MTKRKPNLNPPSEQPINFYGLDHVNVDKRFEGGQTYLNDVCIEGGYLPWAVYRCAKPNKAKGHKKYMLLQIRPAMDDRAQNAVVTGLTPQAMAKVRYQDAVWCLGCNRVIRSIYRHDFRGCGCPNRTFADGGADYLRYGGKDFTLIKAVKVDVLTGEAKLTPLKKARR